MNLDTLVNLDTLGAGRSLVLGFGREGRALERAVLARGAEARVEVLCDRMPEVRPRHWPLTVGPLESIARMPDRVLRSPGVPCDHPVLGRWRAAGVETTCISSLWFGERADARVIAVTGSKGKSTTAALIAHMLSAAGNAVALGGNIGVPMLDLIDARPEWFVIELSSYQLADLHGHASIGAITRLFPEHQDWHRGVEAYYAAKLRLIELLDGRPLWINGGDPVLSRAVAGQPGVRRINCRSGDCGDNCRDNGRGIRVVDHGIVAGDRLVLSAGDSPLPGRHNLDNIALALGVVGSITEDPAAACASLESFRALPHRLEPVPVETPETWINDSISTTPYATLAALEATARPVVLIVGGLERGADWSLLADLCRQKPLAGVVGLPDNGAAICRRLTAMQAVDSAHAMVAPDMPHAVARARDLCRGEGSVLLSPGAPSFPHFRDFEQRGQAFIDAVRKLG